MSDYIDRKALLDAFCNENCNLNYDGTCHNCRSTEIIADFQASDVARVVHGKWNEIVPNIELNDSVSYYACSVCGHPSSFFFWKDKYCQNCGAKMDL